jgi:hypothetical protein
VSEHALPNLDFDPRGACQALRLAMGRARLLILLLLAPLGAGAEIYKCVDEEGNVSYTNAKRKGCTAMDIGPYREPAGAGSRPKAKGNPPAPANFPSVDSETQKQRDQGRRRILETELTNEEKLLADARRALLEGQVARDGEDRSAAPYADRVRKLKETVNLHEQNVAALKRELSNVR